MSNIHPTAIIEDGAQLGEDVTIGPYCHVGPRAVIGDGTTLHAHVVVANGTTLGKHNVVHSGAVLGGPPQDLRFRGENTQLVIGDHNVIRECFTANIGSTKDDGVTRIGNHNMFMAYMHVGHDCKLGSHLVIANAVQLAGHIKIEDHANIGGATAIHHFTTIGRYAFIGGMTRVFKDVPPFMKVEGNPARVRMFNDVGLARHGFEPATIAAIRDAFFRIYRRPPALADDTDDENLGVTVRIARTLLDDYPDIPAIAALVENITNSARGVHGRYREAQRKDSRYAPLTRM